MINYIILGVIFVVIIICLIRLGSSVNDIKMDILCKIGYLRDDQDFEKKYRTLCETNDHNFDTAEEYERKYHEVLNELSILKNEKKKSIFKRGK